MRGVREGKGLRGRRSRSFCTLKGSVQTKWEKREIPKGFTRFSFIFHFVLFCLVIYIFVFYTFICFSCEDGVVSYVEYKSEYRIYNYFYAIFWSQQHLLFILFSFFIYYLFHIEEFIISYVEYNSKNACIIIHFIQYLGSNNTYCFFFVFFFCYNFFHSSLNRSSNDTLSLI